MAVLMVGGKSHLTLKKWGYLFWTTLGIGACSALVFGFILKITIKDFVFEGFPLGAFEWVFMLLGGLIIATVSHVGFFAYLVIRFLGLSIFKKVLLWNVFQVIIIIITFFDLVYLRYQNFAGEGETWLNYLPFPVVFMAIAAGIAFWKVQQTNRNAFVPALFFLFVVSTLEAVPALRLNHIPFVIFMLVPLIVSNAWQIMQLHNILKKS